MVPLENISRGVILLGDNWRVDGLCTTGNWTAHSLWGIIRDPNEDLQHDRGIHYTIEYTIIRRPTKALQYLFIDFKRKLLHLYLQIINTFIYTVPKHECHDY